MSETLGAVGGYREYAPPPEQSMWLEALWLHVASGDVGVAAAERIAELGITSWSDLDSTERGIANLARVASMADGHNTVVAALTLRSDRDQVARARFGFSDRVRVFLNGRLLYAGDDTYTTRDYRFLGTMGLFDEVGLPLQAGDNELWFAVSENFGGWGIVAEIAPTDRVEVVQ